MANIGQIAVSFTANTAGFTGALKVATEQLRAFGQVAKTVATASVPLQSTLGGVGSAVAMTTGNMARLGQSTVASATNMNLMQAAAAQGQTTLSAFGVHAGQAASSLGQVSTAGADAAKATDSITKVNQKAGESVKAFKTRVEAGNAALKKSVPMGHEIKNSYKLMADGSLQASRSIGKSNKQSILSLLSFQNMAGKIAHYISFSIGVQMVMGISKGIRALIDTMSNFQKEIVRTAGVAGRLGGAFKKTVADLGAVSRELGRNTIFKASEAAHAMYDLASAGFDVAGAMSTVKSGVDAVGPILDYAAAQQIELADATAAVSRALKMFDMDLDDSKNVVDIFTSAIANSFLTAEKLKDGLQYSGAMAHVLGITLNETVASLMTLSDAGLTGAQSGQRLNMIMTKLLKPTDKAKRALASLGLTIEDISPQTHTLSQIFHTLEAAGFGAGEAANFFRARTAGAAAALISNADEMERYRLTLLGAEGITKELADIQEKTLWGSFKLLSAAIESLALSFGDLLMPALMGVTTFLKGTVVPGVEMVVKWLKTFFDIISPFVPLLKWFGLGLLVASTYVLLYAVYAKIATHATNMWTAALEANPFTAPIMAIGLLIAAIIGLMDAFGILGPLMGAISDKFKGFIGWIKDIIKWFNEAGPVIQTIISILFPLVGIIRILTEVFKDDYAEERKMFNYMNKLKESADKYTSSIDALVNSYDKQADAQAKVDKLSRSEIVNSSKLAQAKADAAAASDEVTKSEEAFYSASAQLMKEIASLTEGLNLYIEALGKVGTIQDKINKNTEDHGKILSDIAKKEEDLVDATNRYGVNSQEVADIEDELFKKYKEEIDLSSEKAEMDAEETEEKKNKIKEYNKLSDAEKHMADLSSELYYSEKTRKEEELERTKLLAKKIVLESTMLNYTRYFKEGINRLRDAEQKLYDLELKIYKLRHGVTDTYRDMFDSLAKEGLITQEIIDDYKNMEIAEGSALKEKIDYSRTLETLSDSDQKSVAEWSEAYIDALNDGMTEDAAKLAANKKVGISIDNINGLTSDGIKEILEYIHAQHLADDMNKKIGHSIMDYAGNLYDANQLDVDSSVILVQYRKNVDDLAKSKEDLISVNEEVDNSMIALLRRGALLYQYWQEYGDYGGDIVKTTIDMVKSMNLVGAVGEDEISILKRLNKFYKENRATLEDYNPAEIITALTGINWAKWHENYQPETITADDIVSATAIDSIDEWTSYAQGEVNSVAKEFDGVADSIVIVTDKIDGMIDKIGILIEKIQAMNDIEPPKSKWQNFLDMMGKGVENIGAGQGAEVPGWLRGLAAIFPPAMLATVVPDVINSLFAKAKEGLISLASGVTRTHGPTNALIGEDGAEAVVPLEGANRRFGKEILDEIIPRYFPDILRNNRASLQRGSMVGTTLSPGDNVNNTEETTNISIAGDIIINNPANYDEFYDELLRRIGKSKRLKI